MTRRTPRCKKNLRYTEILNPLAFLAGGDGRNLEVGWEDEVEIAAAGQRESMNTGGPQRRARPGMIAARVCAV